MTEIREAALKVLGRCVLHGDHLGGVMHTGKKLRLQVEIPAGAHSLQPVGVIDERRIGLIST